MSSWTFETYEKKDIYASYRWNKGDGFETVVARKFNGVVCSVLYHHCFNTKQGARRAYKRQVDKIEKGEYDCGLDQ